MTIAEKLKKEYYKTEEITNIKELLDRSANIYKTRVAFKIKDENKNIVPITYEAFKKDVQALGSYLLDKGLKNKRICVIGKNSYKWATSYFASTIVGIVVPLDKELHIDDIINFINVSNSDAILGDRKILDKLFEEKDKLKNSNLMFIGFENSKNLISYDSCLQEGYKTVENGDNNFNNITVDPDELKILLFTSGTTGSAKGVCLSQRNVCSNLLSVYGIVKVKRSDLFLSILPIHHTYECTIGFLLPLYSGATIAFCDGLKHISQNIAEYHPSVVLCVPLLLENVYKKIIKSMNQSLPKKYQTPKENPFPKLPFFMKPIVKSKIKNSLGGRLRVFIVGAAAMNPDLVREFDSLGLPTIQGYGLTECSPLVAGNTFKYSKPDSVGLPIPNVEYKIENPNDEGVGEIIVKGPNVMLGYYQDEEKTSKTIVDGWFHTGDLGKIDDNGYLYITGRCKSVIVTKNGKNIYPEEVEYYLNDSPLISEAIVLGIKKENDDDTYVNAQIFPNIEAITEYLKGTVPTKEEIKKIVSDIVKNVNSKLPNYKHIKSFGIRDNEFEKTTTQKIKRFGDNMKIKPETKEDNNK